MGDSTDPKCAHDIGPSGRNSEEDGHELQLQEDLRLGRKGLALTLGIAKTEVCLFDLRTLRDSLVHGVTEAHQGAVAKLSGFMDQISSWFGGVIAGNYQRINFLGTLISAVEKLTQSDCPTRAIPERVLLPLLEGCSREDRSELVEIWARLLSRSAKGDLSDSMVIRYSEILARQSPVTIAVLDALATEFQREVERLDHLLGERRYSSGATSLNRLLDDLDKSESFVTRLETLRLRLMHVPPQDLRIALSDLMAQGLVRWCPVIGTIKIAAIGDINPEPKEVSTPNPDGVCLTTLGYHFAAACRTTSPRKSYFELSEEMRRRYSPGDQKSPLE